MNILIADPDDEFVTILTYWLRSHGHTLLIARSADETLKLWRARAPELALIDLALPGVNGPEFCRSLRQAGVGIILVLTDPLHEEEEVRVLEEGADDYLPKPISMRQLQARINALGRRLRRMTDAGESGQVTIGPTTVHLARHEVIRNGRRYRLTPIEGRLLQLLVSNAGQVLSASTIVQRIWGYEGNEPHLIKAHIHHLRQKIEPDPDQPRYLLTLPTIGYILKLPEQAEAREEGSAQSLSTDVRSSLSPYQFRSA